MAEFCRLASCVLDHERRRRRAERRKDRRPAGDSWFRNHLSRTARIMAGRGQNPFRGAVLVFLRPAAPLSLFRRSKHMMRHHGIE